MRLRTLLLRGIWSPLPRPWQLRLWMNECTRAERKEVEFARKRPVGADRVREIRDKWNMEYLMLEEEYEDIYSRKLVRKAHRLRVPVPRRPPDNTASNEHWMWAGTIGRWHLSTDGVIAVRAAIRAQQKARLDLVSPWLGSLIGLVGAITGLVAVLTSR